MENEVDAPISVSTSAPVEPTILTATPAEQTTQPKKKPFLIIGIIIAVLLVVGGGVVAFAYFASKNSPEAVSADIFSNLVKEKNVQINGNVKIGNNNSFAVKVVTNNDMNASINISTTQGEDSTFGFDGIFADNNIYFKIDNKSTKNNLTLGELDTTLVSPANLGAMSLISTNDLSGKWWELSIPAAAKELGKYFGSGFSAAIDNVYSCTANAAKSFYQNSDEQIDLYKKHTFITLKEKSTNSYDASIDQQKLADFISALKNTNTYKNLYNCIKGDDSEFNDTSSVGIDGEEIKEQINNTPFSLTINTDDNHRLTKIAFSTKNNSGAAIEADFSFEYKGYTAISAPSSPSSFAERLPEILAPFFTSYQNML
ncbi:hypothetical protein IJG79_01100 [Candidatus Saccharibacteria bacterium]|nr:hypothetical protein [Candidatus Saccharibacteria bacterium]